MSNIMHDHRSSTLLSRVRDDISNLRNDVGSLLSHTGKQTIPAGARDLADQARSGLALGSAYATSRFNSLRCHSNRQSAEWVGGAILVGLLAYGAYSLYKSHREKSEEQYLEESEGEFDS